MSYPTGDFMTLIKQTKRNAHFIRYDSSHRTTEQGKFKKKKKNSSQIVVNFSGCCHFSFENGFFFSRKWLLFLKVSDVFCDASQVTKLTNRRKIIF